MKEMTRKVMLPIILVAGVGSYGLAVDPVWQVVGDGGFSVGKAAHTCIVINGNDVPYVAYMDNRVNINQANVKKFDGSSWEFVGNANFSEGIIEYLSLAINSSGVPYVAYMEWLSTYKTTSMKYDSNSENWEVVGKPSFTSGTNAYDSTLVIDNSDKPFLIYSRIDRYTDIKFKAVAMKYYGGSSWSAVGSSYGFSENGTRETTVAIDSYNVPYVAYLEDLNGDKATVQKYTSYNWNTVGAAKFSAGGVKYISIVLNSTDTPYVAYKDLANGGKATVMKYHTNSNTWIPVGQAGFSAGIAEYVSLAIDGSDTLYVAYSSSTDVGNITVMRYDGSNWEVVGNANFANGRMYRTTSLAIDSKGTPYVIYQVGDSYAKATVKYAPSITCKRKDQDGNCIPGIEDPGWTGPYPEVPFDGNYGQGDGTEEGDRTEDPGWTDPYPEIPCGGTHEQGSDECTP